MREKSGVGCECGVSGVLCLGCLNRLLPRTSPETPMGDLELSHHQEPVRTISNSAAAATPTGGDNRRALLRTLSQEDRDWVERNTSDEHDSATWGTQDDRAALLQLSVDFFNARSRLSEYLRKSLSPGGPSSPSGRAADGRPKTAAAACTAPVIIPPAYELVTYDVVFGGSGGLSMSVTPTEPQTLLQDDVGRLHISFPNRPSRVFVNHRPVWPSPT